MSTQAEPDGRLAHDQAGQSGHQVAGRGWTHYLVLFLLALAPRIYLLHVFDVELSNDGFDAVRTLTIMQTQGIAAVPHDLIDRFILHPLYMILLGALKVVTPSGVDFYVAGRLMSAVLGCLAVLVMFALARRAFDARVAWGAALLLAFAPTFLWESVAILSSTLFLLLYLGVLLALVQERYRCAALLAFLSMLTRYEGAVLLALVAVCLLVRDARRRQAHLRDWFVLAGLIVAVPLLIVGGGWLATGNALEFLGAQSMAAIWLRFLSSPNFADRASFFITQYARLVPAPVVWLGVAGALLAALRPSRRLTWLLLLVSCLYVLFFEALVWLNYTTLEVRFLMYPGLCLIVFAGVTLSSARAALARLWDHRLWRALSDVALIAVAVMLLRASYQQGEAGIRFVYVMHSTQRQVASELARLMPAGKPTNVLVYGGIAGALDMYARQQGLDLSMTLFRYAPDGQGEQYVIEHQIEFIIYPAGNAFATAKYPYLAQSQAQKRDGVAYTPVVQFTTMPDKQVYTIWSVAIGADGKK